jgi:hypothetical protein
VRQILQKILRTYRIGAENHYELVVGGRVLPHAAVVEYAFPEDLTTPIIVIAHQVAGAAAVATHLPGDSAVGPFASLLNVAGGIQPSTDIPQAESAENQEVGLYDDEDGSWVTFRWLGLAREKAVRRIWVNHELLVGEVMGLVIQEYGVNLRGHLYVIGAGQFGQKLVPPDIAWDSLKLTPGEIVRLMATC